MELEDTEISLVETTFIKPAESSAIRPITVYQALQSERLHHDGDAEFILDGVKFSKVLLVTHVISSSDTSDVRGVYDLEDGTGSIRASLINKIGQDPVIFSARVQQFHGGLACVMGKLVQFGQRKSVDIESINPAGYHQAMYHTLECMRLSLFIENQLAKESLSSDTGENVVTRERIEANASSDDSVRVAFPGTSDQPTHHSFCGLPESDPGGNISPLQSDALLQLESSFNHSKGSTSESTTRAASQYPILPPVLRPETTGFVIDQVVDPPTVARTPSPLSSFGSSLHIGPQTCFIPHYGQVAQLRETQLAIIFSLCRLQGGTPYGVWTTDVFQSVTETTETTREEFINDINWLLEEAYIVRPLDDDRIALTPRASA